MISPSRSGKHKDLKFSNIEISLHRGGLITVIEGIRFFTLRFSPDTLEIGLSQRLKTIS